MDSKDSSGLKKCQMRILDEINRVCRSQNLNYCLAYGTCLGAVRHKGFIPWDDDIDIFMPADDFYKLCENADLIQSPFFLQTNETDPEYGLMIARVRDSRTTLIEEQEKGRNINHGVFVDIYPLFNCPNGGFEFRKKHFESMLYRLYLYGVAPTNRGRLMQFGSKVLLGITPAAVKKGLERKCLRAFGRYRYTGFVSSYYGNDSHVIYRYDWFFPPCKADFEDIEVPIPANADAFLKFRYGDYMALPPENERVMHHNYYMLDLENSYRVYYGKYYCQKKNS